MPAVLRFPPILLTGFALEIANLFVITVTQGYLQLPVALPLDRFQSFTLHAALALALLTAYLLATFDQVFGKARRQRWIELGLVALCLFGWRLYFEHGVRLSADAPHYFAQARSVLFDGDVDFDNDYERIRPRIVIADRYPVGVALLSMPALLGAHVVVHAARLLGADFTADGFGYPYETAFELASYLAASAALIYLLRSIVLLVPLRLATLSLGGALLASFLAWYMVIEPGMPHAMSFAWSTFFLGYWLRARPVRRTRDWIVLGVLIGVAAMVRWQNGVLVLLPLVDDWLEGSRSLRPTALVGGASLLTFVPQLVFWLATSGSAVAVPTGGHAVSWSQMRLAEVLFSTNRGLFPWNPVLYLGVIGLVLWLFQRGDARRLAGLFITGFLAQVYVNGTVGIWWAGWSFGGRRFDSCFLFFVVGLAVLCDALRRRPLAPIALGVSVLVVWNVALMQQAKEGLVPPDRLVSFREVSRRGVDALYERWGYPFTAPASLLFAARHGVSPEKFDRLFGHEGFGNFRSDFDASIEPYLASGWGGLERDASGRAFRWSVAREATLLVPLKQARGYALTVDVSPFGGAAPNRLGVKVGETVLAAAPVSEAGLARFVVGHDAWREGVNRVSFYFAGTARASESDPRELAFAFHRVELVALPED